MTKKIKLIRSHCLKIYTVTVSFDPTMGEMTKMSQRLNEKK